MSENPNDQIKKNIQLELLSHPDPETTGKKIIFLIGLLAFLLPSLIYGISVIQGYVIQSSLSHNYFSNLREIFTGILFSIGLMMICYSTIPDSFDPKEIKKNLREKIYARVAAVCSILIALFPTSPHKGNSYPRDIQQYTLNGDYNCVNNFIHTGSALLLFVILSLFCFDIFTKAEGKHNSKYIFLGVLIWIGILIAGLIKTTHAVLIGETIALFAFGISWMIRGKVND